ncbi:hypothetical protein TKK_0007693 [Trichogramma kaykai]|uniref:DNA-directed primase/polymerase protein n=1 Tax=Trichogramma kaykai TaxID=54128 RepID=A0ABD2X7K8_9HYME
MESEHGFWYDYKFHTLIEMLEKYGESSSKATDICIAREYNVEGNRYYYIINKAKFISFYRDEFAPHMYEIVTDKSAIYIDLEYDRQQCYVNWDEIGIRIIIHQLKKFFLRKFHFLKEENIFYLTLDASNAKKFSFHIVMRFLLTEHELMFPNNFDSLKKYMFQFREHLIQFTYNEVNDDAKHLVKYTKNVDVNLENKYFQHLSWNYFCQGVEEAAIPLIERTFIDWKVYSKNRNFRLYQSSKFGDPTRILNFVPKLSKLRFSHRCIVKIYEFSFISKPFSKQCKNIPADVEVLSMNKTCLNDTTIVAVNKCKILEFDYDDLSEQHRKKLESISVLIQNLAVRKGLNIDYNITNMSKLSNNIYCINVLEKYCLIEKKYNSSNRVYFIYNVNTSIVRFKCFKCGKNQFFDIKI